MTPAAFFSVFIILFIFSTIQKYFKKKAEGENPRKYIYIMIIYVLALVFLIADLASKINGFQPSSIGFALVIIAEIVKEHSSLFNKNRVSLIIYIIITTLLILFGFNGKTKLTILSVFGMYFMSKAIYNITTIENFIAFLKKGIFIFIATMLLLSSLCGSRCIFIAFCLYTIQLFISKVVEDNEKCNYPRKSNCYFYVLYIIFLTVIFFTSFIGIVRPFFTV